MKLIMNSNSSWGILENGIRGGGGGGKEQTPKVGERGWEGERG